ncbi:hypothetical protein HZC08_02130 [Candidatus Micrarchaeota archaeon]|nr:hypothetical protein [Candidatus Micrarchaeota archaeon]
MPDPQLPEIKNEHAPLVIRNFGLVPDSKNIINLLGVAVEYGFGCLDGFVSSLVSHEEKLYASFVDLGAHVARHLMNSNRVVNSRTIGEVGTLEEAIRGGRDYSYSASMLSPARGTLDFETYTTLFLKMIFENMKLGFAVPNYHRPFYCPSDLRLDALQIDPRIAASLYEGLFSVMSLYWPDILGPRSPTFQGLNVLVSLSSESPFPTQNCPIQFKGSGLYQAIRGPAVREKEIFQATFGQQLASMFGTGTAIHDVALLDVYRQHLTELSGSNLFLVDPRAGSVETPKTTTAIFPGLTRHFGLSQLSGDLGNLFGLQSPTEAELSINLIRHVAASGGELIATGSALGFIPVKRLFVPKNNSPNSLSDYEIIEFKTGPDSFGAVLGDVYRCFSTSQGAKVRTERGSLDLSDHVSWNVLVEIPNELKRQALHRFTLGGRVEVPPDTLMRSGKVTPFRAPSKERVVTMENHRRERLFAALR